MKLKQEPEDFEVEELTDLTPARDGRFSLYRLEKRGWSTPDALEALGRRWHIHRTRISVGGLKDRHARTIQYLTVQEGPQRDLTHDRIAVTYLGQVRESYVSSNVRANRFRLVLREVTEEEAAAAAQALEEVRQDGVPNYFDDQRFGSVSGRPEFVARYLVEGRYEEALRLVLTAPYAHDRASDKREKTILRTCWGDWARCRARLHAGRWAKLLAHLTRSPTDFKGAVVQLEAESQGFHLSVYQSYLWNRILARWVEERCRPEQRVEVRLRLGWVPMHRHLSAQLRREFAGTQFPLPSARTRLDADDSRFGLVESVLAQEGLRLADLKLRGLRKPFFSRGDRAVLCLPEKLDYRLEQDKTGPGRQKLILSFELGRGSYATLIVKRVQHAAEAKNLTPSRKFAKERPEESD
jgi:tRNA pseudouridine13 synthase